MKDMNLVEYREPKPYFLKRCIWRVYNWVFFLFLPRGLRIASLRWFGAKIGRDCLVYRSVKIYAPWNLKIGNAVCLGPRVDVFSKGQITIGNNVVVSQDSYLCTGSHDISSPQMTAVTVPIVIGDNVWIASKASILPGAVIGSGCVVGACSVIAGIIPEWKVVAGNPARVIKERILK